MRYVVMFLLVMVCFHAEAKDKDVQLNQLITQLESTDIEKDKLPIYTQIVKKAWQSAPIIAEKYGKEGLLLHEKYNEPEQAGYLIAYLLRVYIDRNDLTTAEQLLTRGLEAANKADNARLKLNNLFYRAQLYHLQDRLVLAIDSFKKLTQYYQSENSRSNLGSVYNNIGNAYLNLGDLNSALEYFQKALPLQKGGPNPASYASILFNIGQVFFRLEDYHQAESNYLLGLSGIDADAFPRVYIEGESHLGRIYRSIGKYNKALEQYQSAEQIGLKHNNTGKLFFNYIDQIKLAAEMEDIRLLKELMVKLDQLPMNDLDDSRRGSLAYAKALYFVVLKKWQQAEIHIDFISDNKTYESPYYSVQEALNLAVKIKAELGKIEQAKLTLLETLALQEQRSKENKNALIAQYAQLYKLSQKEQQVQKLQEQTLLQQNTLLVEQKQGRQTLFVLILASIVFIAVSLLLIQRSRNISRQKQMSERLLADKKQFFADISHELRTPLTVFKLKMQELEYNIAENPETVYKLLYERIDSFNHLINDISILAQNDQGELELNFDTVKLFDFFELSERDLSILASKYKLTVKSKIRLDKEDKAYFDSARIRQVLGNLFSNACRYTNSPGVIEFRVSIKKNNLRIIVEDSAPGLSKTQVNKVFDRLYRADKSRSRKLGGSGLGLSICQNLVQGHKGTIVAEQSELGGVKMTINLPVALD